MCVVSMVMDHYTDKWNRRYRPYEWVPLVPPYLPPPTPSEIEEFRRLLDRAREYDKKNSEPDCENDEKRRKLLDLAKELGVDISFVNDP